MRHGGFHNDNCRYCHRMERTIWFTLICAVAAILVYLLLGHGPLDYETRVTLITSLPVATLVHWLVWSRVSRFLPQTHGLLFDAASDTRWCVGENKGG